MSSKLLQRITDSNTHSLAHTTINQTEWLNGWVLAKAGMTKCDPYLVPFDIRNTPQEGCQSCPAHDEQMNKEPTAHASKPNTSNHHWCSRKDQTTASQTTDIMQSRNDEAEAPLRGRPSADPTTSSRWQQMEGGACLQAGGSKVLWRRIWYKVPYPQPETAKESSRRRKIKPWNGGPPCALQWYTSQQTPPRGAQTAEGT